MGDKSKIEWCANMVECSQIKRAVEVLVTPTTALTATTYVEAVMAKNHPTKSSQTRENNPNWRGGRLVASNGYVLIRVGVEHHLADVRGYAYEHRLVAEKKIGRRLLPGEQVHHIDHDKQNNDPSNIQVTESIAHHRFLERTVGFNRRKPDEANPVIQCECGCEQTFAKFDNSGRPRRFVTGHNTEVQRGRHINRMDG